MARAISEPKDQPTTVKVVGLFKRKPGLSMEEFKNYYENHHIKLFDEHVSHPGVLRYARRYLEPFAGLASPLAGPKTGGYDVIMEVWYSDKDLFDSFKGQSNPDFSEIVKKDEENLFDRESMVMFISEDHESKDGPWVI
ncbi:uncharacterized protein AB675_10078 [Cyphellophora attinorum]|uniref:EthD domain-containing protein n=1 Tax=Cyphellophora attinorum TaxID=1664694 RepID=A0A0N0NJ69_9EURO|nr:uncharacterized protein AB675_10078 [Phialophora attinorum]KPI36641.1 hypothetical protein AB675_10078 [Phialophora attinorum]